MATEREIKEAMEARGGWFVPVLISDLRQTADKGLESPFSHIGSSLSPFIPAGKPSVVVDAVFHSSLEERCGVDVEFKMFLIRACHLPIARGNLMMSDGIQSWRSNTLSSSSTVCCHPPSRRQTFCQRGSWTPGP